MAAALPAPATGAAVNSQDLAFVVPEDQALVTFYRPFNLIGGQTYHFAINGARIPGLDVGTRNTAPVPPGPVSISGAWWPVAPKLDFTAEKGAAYFILVTPALLDGGLAGPH